MKDSLQYDDEYPTCYSTHATLCIYLPDENDPNFISQKLGLQPSRIQVNGEIRKGKPRKWPTAWFLNTSEHVYSKDVRRHIDWLVEQIKDNSAFIKKLQNSGSRIHISCFWVSAYGHGGPMLDQDVLKRVAKLGIGINFDIYFAGDQINEVFNEVLHRKSATNNLSQDPDKNLA